MRKRSFLRDGAIMAAATALVVGPITASAFAATPETDPAPLNGYRSVGYVMADTPESRDYQIADIIKTGAINDVTHINYAFGNVTTDLVCDITNPDTTVEGYDPSNPDAGDAHNDYLRQVSAEDSVDGVADTPDQALAGNFNQLRKLKALHPDTKIVISLGGWTWSDNFSDAAATPESRTKLVSSCVDLYLKGNLPVHDGMGGDGAAAGIFDGIDVDWEWPATGGETTNFAPEDKENFLALMEEFRTQLDAFGAETETTQLLTAFAPVGNQTLNGWKDPRLFEVIDWLNIQGYDYSGSWMTTTGHQGNLYPDGDNNWGLALAPEMQAYINAGARPDQLNAGLAAYGQGWKDVENGHKAWQPAEGSYVPRPYYEIRGTGQEFFDSDIGAAWLWNEETGDWWSLDTPKSVKAKAEHVVDQGYGGVMWWDLSGDYENELGESAGNVFRDADSVQGPMAAPVATGGKLDTTDGFSYTASARGAGTVSFALVDGELPEGLSLDAATGKITGPTPAEGSYNFSLAATNEWGTSNTVYIGFVVTPAGVVAPEFRDVPDGYLFADEIAWLAGEGITTGYPDGTFRPLNNISREAMAAFLYRAAGEPAFDAPAESPFDDVATSHAFYKEIAWLDDQEITTGYKDDTFRPRNQITREAMAAFLYRFEGPSGYTAPDSLAFPDVSADHAFYTEIAWLSENEITTGYDNGTFRPRGEITREATAAFLYRLDKLTS